MQRLRQRNVVNLNHVPVFLRQNAVTDAAGCEDRGDVYQRAPHTVAHFMYVVPLLFRHRRAHIVDRHLGLVEQPLENKQWCWGNKRRFLAFFASLQGSRENLHDELTGQGWVKSIAEETSPRLDGVLGDAIVRHPRFPQVHSLVYRADGRRAVRRIRYSVEEPSGI